MIFIKSTILIISHWVSACLTLLSVRNYQSTITLLLEFSTTPFKVAGFGPYTACYVSLCYVSMQHNANWCLSWTTIGFTWGTVSCYHTAILRTFQKPGTLGSVGVLRSRGWLWMDRGVVGQAYILHIPPEREGCRKTHHELTDSHESQWYMMQFKPV